MKKSIINRYEFTDKNQVIIDASVRSIEDLYNYFDRTAPYMKKDLDQEFVDYIIDCVREIGKSPFVIRISLTKKPDDLLMDRVRSSIKTYFLYLKEVEQREIRVMFRRSVMLFGIGLALLALAIVARQQFSSSENILAEVFSQGLTVAAWVSLWEAIANLFIEWHPHRQDIKLHSKVMEAPVIFRHLQKEQNP